METSNEKGKDHEVSTGGASPSIGFSEEKSRRSSERRRRPSDVQRIAFAPEARRHRRSSDDEIAVLPLSRTFSRQRRYSSYSTYGDDEKEQVKRVISKRTIEPHTRLPTCIPAVGLSLIVAYRTLSIHVTDTVSHGVEPSKGHVKDIADLDWHIISPGEALQRLGCHPTNGLDSNQAARRLQQNGKNTLSPPPTHRFRKMYSRLLSS
jgi:hypothetical protein